MTLLVGLPCKTECFYAGDDGVTVARCKWFRVASPVSPPPSASSLATSKVKMVWHFGTSLGDVHTGHFVGSRSDLQISWTCWQATIFFGRHVYVWANSEVVYVTVEMHWHPNREKIPSESWGGEGHVQLFGLTTNFYRYSTTVQVEFVYILHIFLVTVLVLTLYNYSVNQKTSLECFRNNCQMCTDSNTFSLLETRKMCKCSRISYPSHLNFVIAIPCEIQLP